MYSSMMASTPPIASTSKALYDGTFFAQLSLSEWTNKALRLVDIGLTNMTPNQVNLPGGSGRFKFILPLLLAGKDVLGAAHAGSYKAWHYLDRWLLPRYSILRKHWKKVILFFSS